MATTAVSALIVMAVQGQVVGDPADPTPRDLTLGSGGDRCQITHTPPTGGATTKPLEEQTFSRGYYFFTDLEPGIHTISPAHTRNSFSPAITNLVFPAFEPPGVIPATDLIALFAADIYPFANKSIGDLQATYNQSGTTLNFRLFKWNGSDDYDEEAVASNIGAVQADYMGKYRTSGAIPRGGFTFWKTINTLSGNRYFEGRVGSEGANPEFSIYYDGGPMENVTTNIPPVPVTVEIDVCSTLDATFFVSNTTVRLGSDPTFVVPGPDHLITDYVGARVLSSISHPNWVLNNVTWDAVDQTIPKWRAKVVMRRATRFTGSVEDKNSNLPVPEAKVQILDRYGNILKADVTDTNGVFDFPADINGSQTVYVDFEAAGYIPMRQRFTPGSGLITPDPMDPTDSAIMTIDEELCPVPGPTVSHVDFDRHGIFLPGVKRVGDTDMGIAGIAEEALTLTWCLTIDASTFNDTLPPFDSPDGTPPAPVSQSVADVIDDVWCVDPRMFGTPSVFGNPYDDTPTPLTLPDPSRYHDVRDFLDNLGGPTYPGVFKVAAESITPTGTPDQYKAVGKVPLWKLPPGDFVPVFIVLTERGAVTLHTMQYTGDLMDKDLEGIKLPRWLAFAADFMGAVAANG
ncbi:MAG: carboxypeptidase-like regulatory domain-containing protein, partial [Verrucomicrobiota bacterium]